jgi:hypothetical protein
LQKLYRDYKAEVAFLFVVNEKGPHEPPALVQQAFEKAGLHGDDDATRCSRARLGVETLGLLFPSVVDTPDRKVEELYDAYPERLVIVGRDGRIVLDAGHGVIPTPLGMGWDFEAVEAALRELLRPSAKPPG